MKLKSLKSSLSAAIALAGMVFAGASAAETIMSVTQMSYDAVGRLECSALRMNPATYSGTLPSACSLTTAGTEGPDRITKNVYDAAGQVTQVLQAVGTTDQRAYSTFSYSPNGKVVDSIDAKGNRTYLTYDGFDRLKEMFYPSKTLAGSYNPSTQATALTSASPHSGNDSDTAATDYEAYLYDANGNLTWHRRRDGRALDYQYDKLNRQIVRSASDASLRSVHTTYDATGKILKKTFDGFNGPGVSYTYDGFGRVYSTTDMNGREVAYLYNGAGARTLLAHPDNTTLTYTNDYANRLTSITHSSGAVMFSQGYNSLGQRRKLLRGALISTAENTEACASGVNVTCYVYDNIGRLWGMSQDLAGQANDVTWSFAYNRASQIVKLTSDTALYDYRETQSSTQDPTFNGLNQDTGILSTDNSGYDTNGNLTKDGNRVMVYDLENRLLSVAHAGTPTTPFLTLTYDPEGRLSKYTLNGVATDYLYDGTNLIGEYVGGTRQRAYVHGTGVDEPIVWAQGTDWGTRQYFIQNYQGSVIRIADINGNATADIYKYGPYGEPRGANNSASWSGSRFRYTGQTTLPDAELYYYKARVYDPNMGRFLQTDPIGSKDDLNLYAYTGGDPINRNDPDGMQSVGPTGAQVGNISGVNFRTALGALSDWLNTVVAKDVPVTLTMSPGVTVAAQASGQAQGRMDVTRGDAIMYATAPLDGMAAAGFKGATAVADLASLANRAKKIHGTLDPIAQSMRTTAVVQTGEGGTFVGSSQKLLSPAQRAALQPGEVATRGAGHAEMTAVRAAEAAGQNPVAVGVSRPPCANCAAELTKRGIAY